MKVFGFMIPADNVVTCPLGTPLQVAIDDMIAKHIGAIVVVDDADNKKAAGLLTKTDFLEAYQKGLPLSTTVVEDIMSKHLFCLSKDMHKDEAAKFFGRTHVHHAIVTDDHTGDFVGLVSAYDIAADTANEDRAWPWIRSEDGKFHHPFHKTTTAPESPSSVRRDSHAFLDYIDSVRGMPFMDD
jgi:CBS domain-containing protein